MMNYNCLINSLKCNALKSKSQYTIISSYSYHQSPLLAKKKDKEDAAKSETNNSSVIKYKKQISWSTHSNPRPSDMSKNLSDSASMDVLQDRLSKEFNSFRHKQTRKLRLERAKKATFGYIIEGDADSLLNHLENDSRVVFDTELYLVILKFMKVELKKRPNDPRFRRRQQEEEEMRRCNRMINFIGMIPAKAKNVEVKKEIRELDEHLNGWVQQLNNPDLNIQYKITFKSQQMHC